MYHPWKSRVKMAMEIAMKMDDLRCNPTKLPSGKRLHNYGKSPFFMGKSTINDHFQ